MKTQQTQQAQQTQQTQQTQQAQQAQTNYNEQDIRTTFSMMSVENHAVEVRALGMGSKGNAVYCGFFTDEEAFVREVLKVNEKAKGVYVTLNPVGIDDKSTLLNKALTRSLATKDKDIVCRRWLLIDIDPKRASNLSSTKEELQAARVVADKISQFLTKHRWADPIEAISGNGVHLLYAINEDNDVPTQQLIKKVLQTLHHLFSTADVDVDQSVSNAARISKIYGTLAAKGIATIERPHRVSSIEVIPDEINEVSRQQLEDFVAQYETSQVSSTKVVQDAQTLLQQPSTFFDVEGFIQRTKLKVAHIKANDDGSTTWVLDECPWKTHSVKDRGAFITRFANGALAAGCHHDSCHHQNWHTLRAKLEPKKQETSSEDKVDKFIREIQENCIVYKDSDATLYTLVDYEGKEQQYEIESNEFKGYLQMQAIKKIGKVLSTEYINQIRSLLVVQAQFHPKEKERYLRVHSNADAIFIDIGNKNNDIIQITKNGIKIAQHPTVLFKRGTNFLEQVMPDLANGTITELFKYIRLKPEDQLLTLVFLCTAFISDISHTILILQDEKGAAKSTTMKMLRSLIDPAKQALNPLPSQKMDFTVTLHNNYVSSFDNMRYLDKEKSDILCMTSTGGAVTLRKLYTTSTEVLLDIRRVVMLNGINFALTEPDLMDRALLLELLRIPDEERLTETEVWANFEADRPIILGGICNVLQKALSIYPTVTLSKLPRMADFAKWGYAIAEAIEEGQGEAFLQAYENNRQAATATIIDSHPVSAAIQQFMKHQATWKGSVTDLLNQLDGIANQHRIDTTDKRYPRSASILSRRLTEINSNLKDVGITFEIRNVSTHKQVILRNAKCSPKVVEKQGLTMKKPPLIDMKVGIEQKLKDAKLG